MYDPDRITYFGLTDYRGKQSKFGIKAEDRTKHVYVIGKTGMGKSNALEIMAIQDIRNGEGLAFLDPHGKSAELLLDFIPEDRIDDVLYFAPFDTDNPISFNIMEDVGFDKRHLVVSGLMSAFKKLWEDQWSARMEYILNNALLALLEYPGSTILGVNRMFADKAYRKKVVANITDVSVKAFWEDEYAKYSDRFATEATAAIQNKVGQFISNPLVRNIIGQPKSSFNLREIMDQKKILIINLSKGLVGEDNANLLGSFLITKIYLASMSRSDVSQVEMNKLPNFYLYVDEFQSFANESFAGILSEARKYKLNLTMAHQYIEQMTDDVREAVFGNVGTMVTFRVGAYDAEVLEKEFAPEFEAEDLVNLSKYQMYLKLMVDAVGSRPFSAVGIPPYDPPRVSYKDMVISRSRKKFAKHRDVVEEEITRWYETGFYDEKDTPVPPKNSEKNEKRDRSPQQPTANRFVSQRKPQTPQNLKQGMSNISEREKRLRKAVSLDHLKSKKKPKKKTPSKQNVNNLRSALSTVLADVRERHPGSSEAVFGNDDKKIEPDTLKRDSQNANLNKSISQSSTPVTPKPASTADPVQPKIENTLEKKSGSTKGQDLNEVPEDVLKKILDVK